MKKLAKLLCLKTMNVKTKSSLKTILRYIRDFSIVVGGVAVTLYVTDKATYRSEKRDIKLYLNTIKLELEENIYEINLADESLEQHAIKYTHYLWNCNSDSLCRDSLENYGPMSHTYYHCTLKTNAFEMFKNSGLMRLMNNRELLKEIWDVYASIDLYIEYIGKYNKMIETEMEKDILLELEHKPKPYNARMFYFHYRGMPLKMKEVNGHRLTDLHYAVSEIEKELSPKL